MEIKKLLYKKLCEEKGSTILIFILVVILIMTFSLCGMEYYRVMEVNDKVKTEMERSSNIAVEYAMIDEARGYHLSKIDEAIAQQQFTEYFTDRLNLNGNFEKFVDGERFYRVEFSDFTIDPEKPQIQMQGTLYVDLKLVKSYVTIPIALPFNITSKNVNVED